MEQHGDWLHQAAPMDPRRLGIARVSRTMTVMWPQPAQPGIAGGHAVAREDLSMVKPWETDLTVYDDEGALLEGLRQKDRLACTCLLKRFAPRLFPLALQLT